MSEVSHAKFATITIPTTGEEFVLPSNKWLLNAFKIDIMYQVEFSVGFGVRDNDGEWHGPYNTEEEAKRNHP